MYFDDITKITFYETVNVDKLHYILCNKEQYADQIADKDNIDIVFNSMSKYLGLVNAGRVKIHYMKSNKIDNNMGRLFVKGESSSSKSPSLQSFRKVIRHTIARDFYIDIDVVNCHPTILLYLCDKYGIRCPYLREYVEDRNNILDQFLTKNKDLTIEDVKIAILSLMNGGFTAYNNISVKPRWIREFKLEIEIIFEELEKQNVDFFNLVGRTKNYNYQGCAVNHLLCKYENEILLHMVEFFKQHKIIIDNCSLCFDGVMVLKNDDVTDELLIKCEKYIFNNTGITPYRNKIKNQADE